MIDIVCLKWGTKFTPNYVNHLYSGVKRNTTVNFNFHCFTDDETDIIPQVICHKLPNNQLTGWWNKLWLFSNELPIENGQRVMFFDLDTLITGNIDHMLSYNIKQLAILINWYTQKCQINSSIMLWRHGSMNHVWDIFSQDISGHINSTIDGDQEFISRYLPNQTEYLQELFPNQLFSYKKNCSKGLPPSAKIVCYHGTPSIIQSFTETVKNNNGVWPPQQWPKEYWRL